MYGFRGALLIPEAGVFGRGLGATLTVIYSAECIEASRKESRPMAVLPLLVILFIVSYGILTMLVFEQGQTIESQRGLIREMLKDSTQLAELRDKVARDDSKRVHDNPATQVPPPVTKKSDKDAKRPSKSAHSTKEIPGKPAADLEDVRRSTRVI
jgi:hypothetical protein